MATEEVLNKSEFLNWIKTVVGLYHVKQGILDFVEKYINEFHTQTFKKVDCNSCSNCSKESVCEPCEKKIQKLLWQNHRFNKQKFTNISFTKSIQNPWELARYFMNEAQPEMVSPETTDCSAVISIMVNYKFIETKLSNVAMDGKTDIFSKTRVVRNYLFHSGDFKLSKDNLEEYLQRMKDVLSCSKEFDQSLISQLDELKTEEYVFTKVPAKLIMNELVGGITGKVEEVRNQMQDGFKAIADNLKDHADKNNVNPNDLNLAEFFNEVHDKTKEYFERKKDDAVHNTESLRKLEEKNAHLEAEVLELKKGKNKETHKLEEENARLAAEVSELKKFKNLGLQSLNSDQTDGSCVQEADTLAPEQEDTRNTYTEISPVCNIDIQAKLWKQVTKRNVYSPEGNGITTAIDTPFDGNVQITGSAYLWKSGHLILADLKSTLLVYSTDGKFIRKHQLNMELESICTSIGNDYDYVRVLGGKSFDTIVAYRLQNEDCIKESTTNVSKQARCITTYSNELLHVSPLFAGYNDTIKVYNIDGELLTVIDTVGSAVYSLHCSPDNNHLYFGTENKVVCSDITDFDEEATPLPTTIFEHPVVGLPLGLSCDNDGSVFVAVKSTVPSTPNHVHRISSDGKYGCIILNQFDGFKDPGTICFYPGESLFVVTKYFSEDKSDVLFNVYKHQKPI